MGRFKSILHIHSTLSQSRANGPGQRAVIWFQGCALQCHKCFNPDLRHPGSGREIEYRELFVWLSSIKNISGLTLSGGEPTDQIHALIPFLQEVRIKTDISIILFSGRTIDEIAFLPEGEKLLSLLDVLIDGRFDAGCANQPGVWPSSANQEIHFMTGRYSMEDFSSLPVMEVKISETGEIIETGVAPDPWF